jgi:arsenate reductase-like glutaredoxin family protein
MSVTLYGLKTCDTCRKAQRALAAAGHAVQARDVRAEPLTADEVANFVTLFGDALVNSASTTWRALTEVERALAPAALFAAYPALMKRPILKTSDGATLGWSKAVQEKYLVWGFGA